MGVFWGILGFMVVAVVIAMIAMRIILGKPSENKNVHSQQTRKTNINNQQSDESYIQYIMSNNPMATRGDVVSFLKILDNYDNTGSKELALAEFDGFIYQLASENPFHAMQVNGFFCGLLGKNISLSDNEIDELAKKNTPMILSKLNSKT